jgi:transposase
MPQRRYSEDRRHLAIQLTKQGKTSDEIARALGCTRVAVWKWVTRFNKGGPEALKTKAGPRGPKWIITDEIARELVKSATERGDVHTWLAMHALAERRVRSVSEPAVRRKLQRLGYYPETSATGRTTWRQHRPPPL